MAPKIEVVREWLTLARKDVESARVLLDGGLLETSCFHCQQAVEKSLKAVLILNGQRPPRTHKLGDLFGLVERWIPGVSAYEPRCEWLTSCAVEFRYPPTGVKLTLELVRNGLTAAKEVHDFVCRRVTDEARP